MNIREKLMKLSYDDLMLFLRSRDYEFFNLNVSMVSDEIYDTAHSIFTEMFDYEYEDMPSIQDHRNRIELPIYMASVNRFYEMNQVMDFIKSKNHPDSSIITLPKINGISFSVLYQYGIMTHVCLRGNKKEGGYIGHILPALTDLKVIINDDNPFLWLRGEIYIDKTTMEFLSDYYSNPENNSPKLGTMPSLASSRIYSVAREKSLISSNSNDPDYKISLSIFESRKDLDTVDPYDETKRICEFVNVRPLEPIDNVSDVIKLMTPRMDYRITDRFISDYPVDGLIVRVSDKNISSCSSKKLRSQVAFKFPSMEYEAEIKDIIPNVNGNGLIYYSAILKEEVGDEMKCGKLHIASTNKLIDEGYHIGGKIRVVLKGDTMYSIAPSLNKEDYGHHPKQTVCPGCGKETLSKENQIYCSDIENCDGVRVVRLTNAFSRLNLSINGITDTLFKEFEMIFLMNPSVNCCRGK